MTEERKICPLSMALASFRDGQSRCVGEECMAWEPEHRGIVAEPSDPMSDIRGRLIYDDIPGRCRLIP